MFLRGSFYRMSCWQQLFLSRCVWWFLFFRMRIVRICSSLSGLGPGHEKGVISQKSLTDQLRRVWEVKGCFENRAAFAKDLRHQNMFFVLFSILQSQLLQFQNTLVKSNHHNLCPHFTWTVRILKWTVWFESHNAPVSQEKNCSSHSETGSGCDLPKDSMIDLTRAEAAISEFRLPFFAVQPWKNTK